jgi:phospholipase/carboxylesterase
LTRTSDSLVVLLHGIGGSGGTLAPIAVSWRASMKGTSFASPDAPFPYPGSGHQWFGVDGRELQPDRIARVRSAFDDTIERELRRAGFEARLDRVAFVGVSQGAIIALDAVASGRWPVRALVTFAGLLPPIPISTRAKTTDVLLIHGLEDQTIPPSETLRAAQRLDASGFKAESHVLAGVGHTVTSEGLELAQQFLMRKFAEQ